MPLLGCFGRLGWERLGAGPGMFGDVEEDAFGAVKLYLEAAGARGVRLVHVVLAAEALQLPARLLDILDQHAEMMQPGVVHIPDELVGLEPQDRQIDRAVAQMVAIGERSVVRADDLEVKRLYIEIGHRVRILGGDGDVAQFGHYSLLRGCGYSAASLTSAGSGSAPAQPCSAMSK